MRNPLVRRGFLVAALAGLMLLMAGTAVAAPIDLNNTGINLSAGQDQSWEILYYNGSVWTSLGQAYFVVYNGYPGAWVANDAGSAWIGPHADYTGLTADPDGDYIFRTTFTVSGDPSALSVSGLWSTDNQGLEIALNGGDTGAAALGETDYHTLHAFTIGSGFVSGLNTLDIYVHNQLCLDCGNGPNPVGARFDVTEIRTPEPASLLLIGVGLGLLGVIRRRKLA